MASLGFTRHAGFMDMSSRVADAVDALARRRGLTSDRSISEFTGVARSTLWRMRSENSEVRGDVLRKLDRAFGLARGSMARVQAGELAPDDIEYEAIDLAGMPTEVSSPSDEAREAFRSGTISENYDSVLAEAFERDRIAKQAIVNVFSQLFGKVLVTDVSAMPSGVDLEFVVDGQRVVVEVKAMGTPVGRPVQIEQAVGQLIRYRSAADDDPVLVLATDVDLEDEDLQLLDAAGIQHVTAGTIDHLTVGRDHRTATTQGGE